ncbi:MAG: DMT family transporter [Acidaminococcaceae bacterium]|nr:DMT family transporter [Acidaminococcaceae bacterium]
MRNKILMGHLFALVTILLWGTTFISTKVLLRSFMPIEILFFRFIMGLIVLFLIYPHRLRVTDKKQEWIFAGAGLSGITLYYLFENITLVYAPASNVGVITATAPFFTALLACRFFGWRSSAEKIYCRFRAGYCQYRHDQLQQRDAAADQSLRRSAGAGRGSYLGCLCSAVQKNQCFWL